MDLEPRDGFALYAEHDGLPGFGADDLARGPSTSGFAMTRVEAGTLSVRLAVTTPITGYSRYYVVIHPSARPAGPRRIVVSLPAGGLTGSVTGPDAAVRTPARISDTDDRRLVIRSQAPPALAHTRFTPVSRPPGSEDAYDVDVSGLSHAAYATSRVVFFNAPGTRTEGAILRRPDTAPAVHPLLAEVSTSVRRMWIGDGTGVTETRPVARNNQLSNAVYAAVLDQAGNLSAATKLSQCHRAESGDDCETIRRGNPVVGPAAPTAVEFGDGLGSPAAVNRTNRSAVPVHVRNPAAAGQLPAGADPDTLAEAVALRLQLAEADQSAAPTSRRAPPATVSWAPAVSSALDSDPGSVDGANYPGVADGANAVVTAVAVDAAGNTSDVKSSTPLRKDVTPPVLVSVSTPGGGAQPGTVMRVQFSEPMLTAAIEESTTLAGPKGSSTEMCATQSADNGVDRRLRPSSAGGEQPRTWGVNPCFHWAGDGSSATVKLGDSAAATALVASGDVVTPEGFVAGAAVVRDLAGNQAITNPATPNVVGSVVVSTAGLHPVNAVTADVDADGLLDAVDVEFTAAVDGSNFDSIKSAFVADAVLDGGTAVPVDAVAFSGSGTKVRFTFREVFGTAMTPSLRLVQSGAEPVPFRRAGSTELVRPFSIRAADKAAPRPVDAWYTDEAPADGFVDTLRVRYSERVEHVIDNNTGYRAPPFAAAPAEPVAGLPTDTKLVRLSHPVASPPATYDTGIDVALRYAVLSSSPDAPGAPFDTATPRNRMDCPTATSDPCYEREVADGARPFAVSHETRDLDLDGKLDAVDIVYSEPLASESIRDARFSLLGRVVADQVLFGPAIVRLVIDEADGLAGDSDATPVVSYHGRLRDASGNEAAPRAVAAADAAGPAIAAACVQWPGPATPHCPSGEAASQLQVTLSERVEPSSVSPTDFVVEQPAGTPLSPTGATLAPSGNVVSLSFAAGQLVSARDAVVRFSGAGAVRDGSGTNPSSQTEPLVAFAEPTVTLSVACSSPARAGYCTSRTVDVAAVGSSGVTGWRLATSPGGTDPPASEFTATAPDSFTFPTEGPYTLYLAAIDAYGRVSPEASARVTILDAPTVARVTLTNLTVASAGTWSRVATVVDGDRIRIGADATGADAGDWASATGDCLVRHMAIDLRAVSADARDAAVAPFSCELFGQTRRRLQFPLREVAGTTRYPVGAVLTTSARAPGYLITDAADGTQTRRRFVSVNARRSWQIPDAAVLVVPPATLRAIPHGPPVSYRDGAVLRAPNGSYYVMTEGRRRYASRTVLAYWRIPLTVAHRITSGELSAIPAGSRLAAGGHPVGTWLKLPDGRIQQVARTGSGRVVRRTLASRTALRTLVPAAQVYPANSHDVRLPVDTWLRGYRDGTLVALADGGYGVVARAALRRFANPATFNTLGYNASNAVRFDPAAMPRHSGTAHRVGVPIDRYLIARVVIAVTNVAGAQGSATVLPTIGGIYGVGTADPVPSGWDRTRS